MGNVVQVAPVFAERTGWKQLVWLPCEKVPVKRRPGFLPESGWQILCSHTIKYEAPFVAALVRVNKDAPDFPRDAATDMNVVLWDSFVTKGAPTLWNYPLWMQELSPDEAISAISVLVAMGEPIHLGMEAA